MSATKKKPASIARSAVQEDRRLDFLPHNAGAYFLSFEQAVFNCAGHICADYKGGFWNYYELSNGGWYMAPDLGTVNDRDNKLDVSVDTNGYRGRMSDDALGIVVCITITNHMLWALHTRDEPQARKFDAAWRNLQAYAYAHPEVSAILGAID